MRIAEPRRADYRGEEGRGDGVPMTSGGWRTPPWMGPLMRFHLGKNKEVFDAELFAPHYRAVKAFDSRSERGQDWKHDSTTAIVRAQSDSTGSGQRFVIARDCLRDPIRPYGQNGCGSSLCGGIVGHVDH